MIDLKDYAEFWQRTVADALEGAATVLPVTIDREMGKKIQSLPADSLTLFMLPPMAVSTSRNTDAYREKCDFVVFQNAVQAVASTTRRLSRVTRLLSGRCGSAIL